MKQIQLTRKDVAFVDDEDFEYLNQFNWFSHKRGNTTYARRTVTTNGRTKKILMHRELLDAERIDHKDGNGLNNCRSNLRPCTHAENMCNRRQTNGKSGFKGVWVRGARFVAAITVNRKTRIIGSFSEAVDAARAYDAEALRVFGEFAKVNFQTDTQLATKL